MLACSSHGTAWNYLTVQLNRLSEDEAGDPDLYGMFYGGTDVRMIGHPLPVLGDPPFTLHAGNLQKIWEPSPEA